MSAEAAKSCEEQLAVQMRQLSTLRQVPEWLTQSTQQISDSELRFHHEILDFAEWCSVKQMEPYDDFFKKLQKSLQAIFPSASICLFGSAAAQLAVRGSDIDVVVLDTSQDLPTLFRKSEEKLVKVKRFVNVERIICICLNM